MFFAPLWENSSPNQVDSPYKTIQKSASLQSNHISMKKLFASLLFLFTFTILFAQPGDLIIKKNSKGFYLEHKLAPKEAFFPLSRLYNVHPRLIASFNNLDFNKGLSIGQLVNIPLTDTNFIQTGNKGVPVYYQSEKETLAAISAKNGKVPVNMLRAWNNLNTDNVAAGSKIIVGFLITKEMQDKVIVIQEKTKEPVKKEVVIVPPVEEKKKEIVEEKKKEPEIKKEEPKKIEPEKIKIDPSVVKEEQAPKAPTINILKEEVPVDTEGGFFKNHFFQQVKQSPVSKEQTLTSSIFKTMNGWKDAKYYLLINGVEPGTIVKLTNPGNNKIVYAKVLYAMEGIRQNQGLDMRISDATAAALAVSETDKFIVKVNY